MREILKQLAVEPRKELILQISEKLPGGMKNEHLDWLMSMPEELVKRLPSIVDELLDKCYPPKTLGELAERDRYVLFDVVGDVGSYTFAGKKDGKLFVAKFPSNELQEMSPDTEIVKHF